MSFMIRTAEYSKCKVETAIDCTINYQLVNFNWEIMYDVHRFEKKGKYLSEDLYLDVEVWAGKK